MILYSVSLENCSRWFQDLWEHARLSRREAVHKTLADDIYDAITYSSSSNASLSVSDIRFLFDILENKRSKSWEVLTSIGLFSLLYEDGLLSDFTKMHFEDALIKLMQDPDPNIRYYSITAIWQAQIIDLSGELLQILKVETEPVVKLQIRHVLNIFNDRYFKCIGHLYDDTMV